MNGRRLSGGGRLSGTVVHGKGLGRGLGFPTANIVVDADAPQGVWEARVFIDGEALRGMAFVGERLLEAHIFDFEGDLYGREIEVELVKFIREKKSFSSTAELTEQIKKDINGL